MHFEMPRPTEEHKTLARLAGTWSGEEKMHPSPWDPKGGTAIGKVATRVDLDGFFVLSDYVQERDGKVTYRGHGVFGYDAGEKSFNMNWFDSMSPGSPPAAKGSLKGNTLTFEAASPMGLSRYIYTFEAEGRYRFAIEMSHDGKAWMPFLEGTYTRR